MQGANMNSRRLSCAARVAAAWLCMLTAAGAQTRPLVFVDAGAGISIPASKTFQSGAAVVSDRLSSEYWGEFDDSFTARYAVKRLGLADVGGGVVLGSGIVVGAALTHQRGEKPADVTVALRHGDFHPTLTGQVTSRPLQRRDTAMHLSGGYAWSTDRLHVRAFTGPSRFSIAHELMDGLSIEEVVTNTGPPLFTARYSLRGPSDVTAHTVRGSAWGYHVGTDVSFALGSHAGVGVLVRYSDALVTLADPLSSTAMTGYFIPLTRNSSVEIDARRVDVTAGLRLRF